MRISLRNQYSNFLYNLQNTQSRLMELNMQASSQKRINKPSDDAVGTARVLNYRDSLSAITQYQSNIDTAKGWLGLADETMMQASTILTKLKGLAEQGATGTMTAKDRNASSYEVRQLMNQLLSLSNTEYEGSSIFAGQKVESSAFVAGLMVYDQNGYNLGTAQGMAERSIVVQFLGEEGSTATVGTTDPIAYRYSSDGGASWSEVRNLDATAPHVLDLGGVSVSLPEDYSVDLSPEDNTKMSRGSWLTVAPTAIYQGDHEVQAAITYGMADPSFTALPLGGFTEDVTVTLPAGVTFGGGGTFDAQVTIGGSTTTVTVDNSVETPVVPTPFGGIQLSGSASAGDAFTLHAGNTSVRNLGSDVNALGKGIFSGDVLVRIDTATTIGAAGSIAYSYSTDGGTNWSSGHTVSNGAEPELLVPGGTLVLSARGGSTALAENAQFVVHPATAGHDIEISTNDYVQVNNIGSEIFGGYYAYGTEPVFADTDPARNIFVTVGKLVAALENNDQQGCAEALEHLETAQNSFSTQLASVGARENRLDVAKTVLSGLSLNQKERMSNIEDADVATLLTELANQQISYEAVLKSSSMIMKMGLVNYI